ncbi:MAG: cell division protein ZapA [Rhodospirillaceae bacterium]|mgnify:CR=1 FL=1|jgi:cell division protein ZapA|nr:cell division protein ZapA [Rhodospirillaceae bacterium]MBT3928083.1 cell division protein ZapA [Rhodospirillaceae bacterium]MBT4427492.1 cell division protein ZapA [Rhodospirillaceae bacterium]MBT5039426.1 cell division protein ZapA [Rhodospirillaceae bacterium]MBT5675299.1 cell division protein ZapA [Rhodospirillaceae bacterium]
MAQVSVTINGRKYPIVCDDGQEEHVTRLASYIDKRASEIAETVGQVGEARLVVMASLLIADELSEAYDEMERLQVEAKNSEESIRAETRETMEAKIAPVVESLAVRIENIADSLESD